MPRGTPTPPTYDSTFKTQIAQYLADVMKVQLELRKNTDFNMDELIAESLTTAIAMNNELESRAIGGPV